MFRTSVTISKDACFWPMETIRAKISIIDVCPQFFARRADWGSQHHNTWPDVFLPTSRLVTAPIASAVVGDADNDHGWSLPIISSTHLTPCPKKKKHKYSIMTSAPSRCPRGRHFTTSSQVVNGWKPSIKTIAFIRVMRSKSSLLR